MVIRLTDGEERLAEWVDFWQEDGSVLVKIKGEELELYSPQDISEIREGGIRK